MSELLAFVTKQVGQNSELFAKARLKQIESDYSELKKELGEERNQSRDTRHEQETALIKAESQIAILTEKLSNAQRELGVGSSSKQEINSEPDNLPAAST